MAIPTIRPVDRALEDASGEGTGGEDVVGDEDATEEDAEGEDKEAEGRKGGDPTEDGTGNGSVETRLVMQRPNLP